MLRFINHVKYDAGKKYNDIALVQLAKDVPLSPQIRPACLPNELTPLPRTLIATGWGTTSYQAPEGSDILRKVDLPAVANQKCESLFRQRTRHKQYRVRDSQLCYGGVDGKDTCQGDSGGPLQSNSNTVYCSYTVYGVTSTGIGCGNSIPALYTKVGSYISWIEAIVWPMERAV